MCLLLIMLGLVFNIATSNGSNCPTRQSIEQSLEKIHVPGAAIVVVNATHVLYEQAFGYKSLSPKEPMDIENSIFPLASISKTFIGIAVMQLVERELVDLDTDINQYLSEPQRRIYHPQYPSHSVTLRKLLSHSASIYISQQVGDSLFKPNDDAFNESLADVSFKYVNPNTSNWLPKPPGSVSLYSNQGSSLAALVVERVANMSYSDYVEENILKPLGVDISKTGVRLSDFENTDDIVQGYAYAPNEYYVEAWHQVMPQLNITPISVKCIKIIIRRVNFNCFLFRTILPRGYILHPIVLVAIPPVCCVCQLMPYPNIFACFSTMDSLFFLRDQLPKFEQWSGVVSYHFIIKGFPPMLRYSDDWNILLVGIG